MEIKFSEPHIPICIWPIDRSEQFNRRQNNIGTVRFQKAHFTVASHCPIISLSVQYLTCDTESGTTKSSRSEINNRFL
jgi:hypothetical protein